MRLVATKNGSIIADELELATTLLQRLKGLLGRGSIEKNQALIIKPCKSVHMLFMQFPIDVVFCAADNLILALQPDLKPWRFSKVVLDADYVIELEAGSIERHAINVGDRLEITD